MRIELTTKAWEALVLPLNYARIECISILTHIELLSNVFFVDVINFLRFFLYKAIIFKILIVKDLKYVQTC